MYFPNAQYPNDGDTGEIYLSKQFDAVMMGWETISDKEKETFRRKVEASQDRNQENEELEAFRESQGSRDDQQEDSMLFIFLCIAIGYTLFIISIFWKYVQPFIGK